MKSTNYLSSVLMLLVLVPVGCATGPEGQVNMIRHPSCDLTVEVPNEVRQAKLERFREILKEKGYDPEFLVGSLRPRREKFELVLRNWAVDRTRGIANACPFRMRLNKVVPGEQEETLREVESASGEASETGCDQSFASALRRLPDCSVNVIDKQMRPRRN